MTAHKHSTNSHGRILLPDGDTRPTIIRWCYDPADPTQIQVRLLRHGCKVAVASIGRDVVAYVLAGFGAPEMWRLPNDVLVLHADIGMVVTTADAASELLIQIEAEEGVAELVARMQAGAL